MNRFGRGRVPLARGAAGLALLLPTALSGARAASSGWSRGDAAALENSAAAALNASCYFAETPVSCRAATEAAPDWLAAELPALRDCLLAADSPETGLWAFSFRDAAAFLRAARAALPRSRRGRGFPPARLDSELSALREDLAARLDDLNDGGLSASLDGRGALLIARLRGAVQSMDAAISAARERRGGDFRAAVLEAALQVDGAHAVLAAPPPAGAAAGVPACTRLSDFAARPPAPDGVWLHRLARIAGLYRKRGDYPQAAAAYGYALTEARALEDDADAQNLEAGLAEAALELGHDGGMRTHMAAALALARGRGDLFSERALLDDFLARLGTTGQDGDLRGAYAERLSAIAGPLADARRKVAQGAALLARSDYAGAKNAFVGAAGQGDALAALRAGDCDGGLADAPGALADYGRAVLLARAQGNAGIEAEALLDLAGLAQGRSDSSEQALDDYEDLARLSLTSGEAATFAPDLPRRLLRARPATLASLEDLYAVSGRWERAARFYADLLRQARRAGDDEAAFLALVYLGRVQAAGGSPEQGARTLEKSLGLLERGEQVSEEAASLLHSSLAALQPYWTPSLRAAAPGATFAPETEPGRLPFADPGGPRCALRMIPPASLLAEPHGGAR